MEDDEICCCFVGNDVEQTRRTAEQWKTKIVELFRTMAKQKCLRCIKNSEKMANMCGYFWDEDLDGKCCCGQSRDFEQAMKQFYDEEWEKIPKHTCFVAEPYPCGCLECRDTVKNLMKIYERLTDFILAYKMGQMKFSSSQYDDYWTSMFEELQHS